MEELVLAQIILGDILENDTPFNEALRKVFQTDASLRDKRPAVAGVTGCELRHHLLFEFLLADLKGGLTPMQYRYALLALANSYFYHQLDEAAVSSYLDGQLPEDAKAPFAELLKKGEQGGHYIPDSIESSSNKYLSLRFNTPEWVLKIWEHYGYGVTYRLLKKYGRQSHNHVRLRPSRLSKERFEADYPDFAPLEGYEHLYVYNGKSALRRFDCTRSGAIFEEKPATNWIVGEFPLSEPKELFLYNANPDDSLALEFVERYQGSIGINIGVPSLEEHLPLTKAIRALRLKNVNLFAGEPTSFESALSRPQDLVFVCPESTNFDAVPSSPDFFLHFKREKMDAIFAKEKEALEEASKFVAEGGTLVYLIYTVSKKEGHGLIENFLTGNPDFKLVTDKQHFAFEEMETSFYYAVLKRETPLAKLGLPGMELSSLSGSAPSIAQAQAK